MQQLFTQSYNDFKLIFRDTSLKIFLFLPIVIFIIIVWVFPLLIGRSPVVESYLPFIIVVSVVELTQGMSFIYSMVLIDEKETGVAKAYGIVPMEKNIFILSRLIFPTLITVLLIWVLLLAQPFYNITFTESGIFAFLAGLIIPVYVLGVVILSKNRIEGMIWVKGFNILVVLPVLAFFIPSNWQWLLGIFPTHWIFQSLYDLFLEKSMMINWGIGFVFLIGLIFILINRFTKVHFA